MASKTSRIESLHGLALEDAKILAIELKDDGIIPNSKIPLLLYQGAIALPENDGRISIFGGVVCVRKEEMPAAIAPKGFQAH